MGLCVGGEHQRLPPPLLKASTFLAIISSLGFDPLDVVSGECISSHLSRFDNRIIANTAGVAGLCAVNWLIFSLRWVVVRLMPSKIAPEQSEEEGAEEKEEVEEEEDARERIFCDHMWAFLMITYLFYPTLSRLQVMSGKRVLPLKKQSHPPPTRSREHQALHSPQPATPHFAARDAAPLTPSPRLAHYSSRASCARSSTTARSACSGPISPSTATRMSSTWGHHPTVISPSLDSPPPPPSTPAGTENSSLSTSSSSSSHRPSRSCTSAFSTVCGTGSTRPPRHPPKLS